MAKEKSILTAHQGKVLNLIADQDYFTDRFYLAGGTALSEFYLKHRMSEDLDFFCEQQEVDPIPIIRFFEQNLHYLKLKKITTKRVFGLYSFFLHFQDGQILKVDFNYYPFTLIEKGIKFNNLKIESVYDIAVDKVHTIAMKPRARDFIDIYFIIKIKNYRFDRLLMDAKAKFDWDISLIELGSRLIEAKNLKDYPKMLKKIDHHTWQQFFLEEAKKLKKDILK